jgi:two-component system, chemotaxis family, protein-glutamate methylesterase/glutaminase
VRTQRVRVLVVDDSAFARKVVRETLATSDELEVVGVARDGLEALEAIAELKPDVVTLDLVMPNLDGVGTLRELLLLGQRTRVVIVSISDDDSDLVMEAFQLGAVDLVRKPTALATNRLYELRDELVRKVLAAARAKPTLVEAPATEPTPMPARVTRRTDVVAIGTSTGGPQALTQLMRALPADFPSPIVMALHIPGEYTGPLAERLNQLSQLNVVEAADGLELVPGLAVLARGGLHLRVARSRGRLIVETTAEPSNSLYMPSVDVLFTSVAEACGARAIGVVLTGMGEDGLLGARALSAAGASLLTEAEESCVIYGMPRAVAEAGLSSAVVKLPLMSAELIQRA